MAANSRTKAAVEIPECPVCLERMTAPIYLCQSGHSICAGCTRVLSPPACPVCRQPMTQMRNVTLEDIINEAKVPCPNSDAGCTFTLAGANVADHLRQCIFRQLYCPLVALGKCSWTGLIKQMADHFKEKHPAEFSGGAEAELELTNMSLKQCDRRMFLATLHRLLFIVTFKVDSLQRMVYWTCQLIGPKILAHQHIYEIHVKSKRNPHRKIVFTEHCMSDEMKSDDIIRQSNCAIMPIDTLGNFTSENKRSAEPGQFRQAVEWGIEAGYRHIDTAACYNNEEEVGQGIANAIKRGLVTRQDLFVTTKLWNDCHAEEAVVPALEASLKRLGLDYVDLYLVHWPVSVNAKGEDMRIPLAETWRGMEAAATRGLARGIGVSNFNENQLEELLKTAEIKPVVNQIEVNPTLTQHKLVNYCKSRGVVCVAYTPLGLLSGARPEFAGKDTIKQDPALGRVAETHGRSRPQIALRYLIQRSIPVIPKSFTQSRIVENLDLFSFELTQAEMDVVDSYNLDHRCVPATSFAHLTNYPF